MTDSNQSVHTTRPAGTQGSAASAGALPEKPAGTASPLFSVVMPAYNVEHFLEDAVSDILGQTFTDWELIIVDDCSSDQTRRIAWAYADAFDGIRVLQHAKNRGVSEARNTGLAAARGEYVLFLDPDDRYDEGLLDVVAASLGRLRADVVVYGLEEDYYGRRGEIRYVAPHAMPTAFYDAACAGAACGADGSADISSAGRPLHFDSAEATGPENGAGEAGEVRRPGIFYGSDPLHRAVAQMEQETLYGYAWNKAFRRDLLLQHGLKFARYPHIEDIMFNLSVFEYVQRMTILEDILYGYRNQGQSRLTDRYQPNYLMLQKKRFSDFLDQQERWGVLDEKVLSQTAAAYFRSYLSAIEREQSHHTPAREIYRKAKKEQTDPVFLRLRDHLPGEGFYNRFFYRPLARGKISRAITRCWFVSLVRRSAPELFAKVKQHRG